MTFKKFYNDFGHGLPMSVVKAAFGYVQQGHDVEPALGTAKILYAAKLERQPLCHTGYVRIVGEKRLQDQCFVPVPGTWMYGSFIPTIINKDDFNVEEKEGN